jgi:hypothetical protein
MTEKQDYTGEIRRKGLGGTTITEDHLRAMHAHRGSFHMGIVELEVDETREKTDANKVMLTIKQVFVVTDPEDDAHLRQLTRSLNQQIKLNSPDQPLPIETQADLEPSVEEVRAARRAHDAAQPHVFDSDDNELAPARCLLCGELEDNDLHVPDPADLEPGEDPEPDPNVDKGDDGDDLDSEPATVADEEPIPVG